MEMSRLWWSVETVNNMFEPCDEAVRDMLDVVNAMDAEDREAKIRRIVAVVAEHAYLYGYAEALRNREVDA